ncbi:ABC transporter permease [Candidatus Poribacteria bacterium]|nr:ABC transporter permease [Candidatus Poribacteria bacterium]
MILKIAFRNIFRQKRRSILTALAMIVGFSLSSFTIGLSDGAYSNIINMFTRNRLGHIQVHSTGYLDKPTIYNTISDYESIGETIQSNANVEAWTPRVYAGGLGSVNEKSMAIKVVGIDVVRENQATNFDKKVVEGKTLTETASHEAIIGIGLAKRLSATVGNKIAFFSQAADGSIANDEYTIIGTIESGDDATDRTTCYLHIDDAQDLFVLQGRVHEIVVIVSNMNSIAKTVSALENSFNDRDIDVSPWQVFAKSFYIAMQTDRKGDAISRFIIMFIVAIGVLNTVLMSVLERTREYGVLKAVGTKPSQIFGLVVSEVTIIALVSVCVGAIIGTVINYLFSVYGITYPTEITFGGMKMKTLYGAVTTASLVIPTITVMLSAILVSLFPAIKAARIIPAKAMRIH